MERQGFFSTMKLITCLLLICAFPLIAHAAFKTDNLTVNNTDSDATICLNSDCRTAWPVAGVEEAPFTNQSYARKDGNWTVIGEAGAEVDPVFTASIAFGITTDDTTNWTTAFGWGDHASAGYLTDADQDDILYGRKNGTWQEVVINGTIGNPFDQSLNATDAVNFSSVTATLIGDGTGITGLTSAQVGAVPLDGNVTINDTKTFAIIPFLPASNPTQDNEATRKAYVDGLFTGQVYKEPVLSKIYNAPPTNTTGDRYIVNATGSGAWSGRDNDIAKYNGTGWEFDDPSQGWTLAVLDEAVLYNFNNVEWVYVSPVPSYTASDGVEKIANDFSIDLSDTNPSLEVTDGGLRAKVGSTIQRTSSGLVVNPDLSLTSLGVSDLNATTRVQFRNNTAFDYVQFYSGSAYSNHTTEAKTTRGTAYTLLADSADYFYVGKTSNFTKVYFDLGSAAVGNNLLFSYKNATGAWNSIIVADGTNNLTADGSMTFTAPVDWAQQTVNSIAGMYWFRFNSTTSSTTDASAYVTATDDKDLFQAFGQYGDASPALGVTKRGTSIVNNVENAVAFQSSITTGSTITASNYISSSLSVANTINTGIYLAETTAATSAAPIRNSPAVTWLSRVWNSTPTARSYLQYFTSYVRPVNGTSPTANLIFSYGDNTTAAWNERMNLSSNGTLKVSGNMEAQSYIGDGSQLTGISSLNQSVNTTDSPTFAGIYVVDGFKNHYVWTDYDTISSYDDTYAPYYLLQRALVSGNQSVINGTILGRFGVEGVVQANAYSGGNLTWIVDADPNELNMSTQARISIFDNSGTEHFMNFTNDGLYINGSLIQNGVNGTTYDNDLNKTGNVTFANTLVFNYTIPLATPYNVTAVGEFSGTPNWGTDTGVYYYRVTALDASGVEASVPSADIAVSVDNATVDMVNITWQPVPNAVTYAVARDVNPSNEYIIIDNCIQGAVVGQSSYNCIDYGTGNAFNITGVLPTFVPHRGVGGWVTPQNITFPVDPFNNNSFANFGSLDYSYTGFSSSAYDILGRPGQGSIALSGWHNGTSAVMLKDTLIIAGTNPALGFVNTTPGAQGVFFMQSIGDDIVENLSRLSLLGGITSGLITGVNGTWDGLSFGQAIIGGVPAGSTTRFNFTSKRTGGILGHRWNLGNIDVRADNAVNLSQYSSMHFSTTAVGSDVPTERLNLTHNNASFYQNTRVVGGDFFQTNAAQNVSWQLTNRTVCLDIGDCANNSFTMPMMIGSGGLGEAGIIKNGIFLMAPEDVGMSTILYGDWNFTNYASMVYEHANDTLLWQNKSSENKMSFNYTDGCLTTTKLIAVDISASGYLIAGNVSTATQAGAIRYDADGHFYGYNGTAWRQLD